MRTPDDRGWTLLHTMALGGNAGGVTALLKHSADPAAKTGHGMTAMELATSLGWTKVIDVLSRHKGG